MPSDRQNPFVKCKSRKKRKKRVFIKPDVKLYCPSAMVRYDGGKGGFSTMWVCKMCLTCCLNDITAAQHSLDCRKNIKESRKKIDQKEVPMSYTCHICNRIFSRQVTLKKHLEIHDQVPSESEMIDSDSEKIVVKSKRRGKRKAIVVDPEFIPTSNQVTLDETDNLGSSISTTSKAPC